MDNILSQLNQADIAQILSQSEKREYAAEERLFHEGDNADCIFLVDSGRVSLYLDKFNSTEELDQYQPGDYLGEIAALDRGYHAASAKALEPSCLTIIPKSACLKLMEQNGELARIIRNLVQRRNEELLVAEKLMCAYEEHSPLMHLSIKGDPSLKKTVHNRHRYDSVVDPILPELATKLEDILLNRCVYKLYLGFNNGEVRLSTVFDPLNEEYHPALRLLDSSYVERHFPAMDYEQKADFVYKTHAALSPLTEACGILHEPLKSAYLESYSHQKPVPKENIRNVLSRLANLRAFKDYYARNISLSTVRDVIRMQFNCDGVHIVTAAGFEEFVQQTV